MLSTSQGVGRECAGGRDRALGSRFQTACLRTCDSERTEAFAGNSATTAPTAWPRHRRRTRHPVSRTSRRPKQATGSRDSCPGGSTGQHLPQGLFPRRRHRSSGRPTRTASPSLKGQIRSPVRSPRQSVASRPRRHAQSGRSPSGGSLLLQSQRRCSKTSRPPRRPPSASRYDISRAYPTRAGDVNEEQAASRAPAPPRPRVPRPIDRSVRRHNDVNSRRFDWSLTCDRFRRTAGPLQDFGAWPG